MIAFLKKYEGLWLFVQSPAAIIAALVAIIIILGAIFAPWIARVNPYDLSSFSLFNGLLPPVWQDGSNPKYLLLDEPSLGLAPKLVQQISELILEINSQGVTVLLVEQNANMALKISSHGYIMETGNIVMDNPSSKLLQDQDVQEFYLGLNAEGTERKSFKDVKHYKRKKRWLS